MTRSRTQDGPCGSIGWENAEVHSAHSIRRVRAGSAFAAHERAKNNADRHTYAGRQQSGFPERGPSASGGGTSQFTKFQSTTSFPATGAPGPCKARNSAGSGPASDAQYRHVVGTSSPDLAKRPQQDHGPLDGDMNTIQHGAAGCRVGGSFFSPSSGRRQPPLRAAGNNRPACTTGTPRLITVWTRFSAK